MPSPHYTPNVFSFFSFWFGKEKFIAMLLFLMWELGQQKVHHRLAKGLRCVVHLSLASAGFEMSQRDKLGNKQVGERIGQSAAWRGCVCCWLRDLIIVLSLLTPSSSSTKPPGVHIWGWIPPPPLYWECAFEPSCMGNTHIFSMWQKIPSQWTPQLMDRRVYPGWLYLDTECRYIIPGCKWYQQPMEWLDIFYNGIRRL